MDSHCFLSSNHLFTNLIWDILVIGSIENGWLYLVKYLAMNSYVSFITIFLKKFEG
ncbi:chloroplast RF [Salix suchowensis]|nr:chloroplast RF [Salix suchowensis]